MISQRRIEQLLNTRDCLARKHKYFRANPPGELGKRMKEIRERIEAAVMRIGMHIAMSL